MQTIKTLFSVSEIELLYHNKVPAAQRPAIKSSQAAYDLLLDVWDLNKIELVEQTNMLLLDSSKRCLGVSRISTGGITHCIIDPRIVFSTALTARAHGIILAHNHPTENLKPSQPDIDLSKKLHNGSKLLDIRMIDHIILSRSNYFSFADNGLIP